MQITCPLVYSTSHEVWWAHSISEDGVSNRLQQKHSIIMKDESSYCEFPYIWQHLATLQHLLLECYWLPCQLVSLPEAAPCSCAGAGVWHSRQLPQESPWAPANAVGRAGRISHGHGAGCHRRGSWHCPWGGGEGTFPTLQHSLWWWKGKLMGTCPRILKDPAAFKREDFRTWLWWVGSVSCLFLHAW